MHELIVGIKRGKNYQWRMYEYNIELIKILL